MNATRAVFADTFYWVAVTNPKDSSHRRALTLSASLRDVPIITTHEVLTEVLAYFAGRGTRSRTQATRNVRRILSVPTIRVIPQSQESFLAGLELYEARPDKGYSLTDCISMNTMKTEGITDILTNDVHFTQEGFRALFRSRAQA